MSRFLLVIAGTRSRRLPAQTTSVNPRFTPALRCATICLVHDVDMSFSELAHRIRAGDRQAEGDLTRRLTQGITQIAVKLTGNFALAQEICQETLIIILTRLRAHELDDPEKLPAFVAQTARNLIFAERRKQRRRKTETGHDSIEEVADVSATHERDAERESAAVAIRKVLSEMSSERDRILLVRFYLHDEDKEVICRDPRRFRAQLQPGAVPGASPFPGIAPGPWPAQQGSAVFFYFVNNAMQQLEKGLL
jgi:RNA polymerase sigma-70 factor (ECF subfamily)